jgi:hypothetical protein
LPELRVLSLRCPSDLALLDMIRFPKLAKLDLSEVELLHVLGQVGRQLTCLHFNVREMVQLDRVLDMCPNLTELSVHAYALHLPVVQPQPLKHLMDMKITICDNDHDHDLHEPMLQPLRLATNLRTFHLTLPDAHGEVLSRLV